MDIYVLENEYSKDVLTSFCLFLRFVQSYFTY